MFCALFLWFLIILVPNLLKSPRSLFIASVSMKYETLPVINTIFDAHPSSLSKNHDSSIPKNTFNISHFFKLPPSISEWKTIDPSSNIVTILSMSVDHHNDASWFIPSLHTKHSIGWNRTRELYGFSTRPYACSLRFYGMALESVLEGYQEGGSGYLTVGYMDTQKRDYWYGFDKNETQKIYCYYMTNKDTGSEFIVRSLFSVSRSAFSRSLLFLLLFQDKPKTLAIAIYCPILLDDEMGQFHFRESLHFGKYCRPLAEYPVTVEIHLRPSSYHPDNDTTEASSPPSRSSSTTPKELIADFKTNPYETRLLKSKEMILSGSSLEGRIHAVCTVQSFKNPFSGPMLYFFIKYYQIMGWR
jgi:hypothetical protein